MTTEDWGRLQEIFHEAADLTTTARNAFLDDACSDAPELRERVDALLASMDETDSSITGSITSVAREVEEAGDSPMVGRRLGPYRIVEEAGRGGMGIVYAAERADGAFEAKVAVKIIPSVLTTNRSFTTEWKILGSLAHPNIARLLDAGRTDDGLPYMVMEFVDGVPIDTYCDAHELSVEGRVRLFLDVCAAVRHAHGKLVVHRDVKPGNIFVTEEGVPKLLDFGIAKLLENADLGEAMAQTATVLTLMTPAYTSPEQIQGGTITAATDVYGLGLVLYELITGRRAHAFRDRSPVEVERVVCHDLPPTPSAAVTGGQPRGGDGVTAVPDVETRAARRRTTPRQLGRVLGGDLETIVMKALRKEPERRYASVEALAQDLNAFLQGLPVSAQPDTRLYRMRRFVDRHTWAVTSTALVVATLVILAVTMTLQAFRIGQERDVAERRRETAAEVSAFMAGVFGEGGEPEVGGSVSPEQVIAQGRARIDALADRPAVQAGLVDALGRLYWQLGLHEPAEEFLLAALEQRRELFGADDADVAASVQAIAGLRFDLGDYGPAADLFVQALDIQTRLLDEDHPDRVASLTGLAAVRGAEGTLDEAEAGYRAALDLEVGRSGGPTLASAGIWASLAETLLMGGLRSQALVEARLALELRERSLPEAHPDLEFSRIQIERIAALDAPEDGVFEFLPLQRYRSPIAAPLDGASGDFDGDGRVDLLFNHRDGARNQFYLGLSTSDGTFRFTEPVRHPQDDPSSGWGAYDVFVGDFDGDGRDDLAWNGGEIVNMVFVALSNGDGSFRFLEAQEHPNRGLGVPYWAGLGLLVGDYSGDGVDDLLWYQPSRMWMWTATSRGDGTFHMPAWESQQTQISLGGGVNQTWAWGEPGTVVLADVDGDGRPEVVWNWHEDFNELWVGTWQSGERLEYRGPIRHPSRGVAFDHLGQWHGFEVLFGDVDGDGRDDVLWTEADSPYPPADVQNRVYVGLAGAAGNSAPWALTRRFQDRLTAGDPGPFETTLGDVNGDGRADLVWNERSASGENRVHVSLGMADGHFEATHGGQLHAHGIDWTRAQTTVADVDGDGRDDIVWSIPDAVNRIYVALSRVGGDGG